LKAMIASQASLRAKRSNSEFDPRQDSGLLRRCRSSQ
jgi:hypothetical protein